VVEKYYLGMCGMCNPRDIEQGYNICTVYYC